MIRNVRYIINSAKRYFFSIHGFTLCVVMLLMILIYVTPVLKYSELKGYPVTLWIIPFLFDTFYFNLIFYFGGVFLFGKVPFNSNVEMYFYLRMTKCKWILFQIGKIIISSFLYVLTICVFAIIVLFRNLNWSMDWGEIYYTLSLTNEGWMMGGMKLNIGYNIISQYHPLQITLETFTVAVLEVILLGVFMFFVALNWNRMIATVATVPFILMSVVFESMGSQIQRLIINFLPLKWIEPSKRNSVLYSVQYPSTRDVIIFLTVLIVLFSALNIIRLKKWNVK